MGLAAAGLLCACTSTTRVRASILSSSRVPLFSVAVASFNNLSDEAGASSAVTEQLLTRLYQQPLIRTIDARRAGKEARAADRDDAQQLGVEAKADAVLYGTVLAYGYRQENLLGGEPRTAGRRTLPSIALTARLVSTQTGRIVWAASAFADDPALFNPEAPPLPLLADELARALMRELEIFLARGDQPTSAPDATGGVSPP